MRMHPWKLLSLIVLSQRISLSYSTVGSFNEAFAESMVDKVRDGMAVPWNPLSSIYAALSSNWLFDGFESGKFLIYGASDINKRPVYYAHMSDRNHSCAEYGAPCWDNYENVTDPETGRTFGPPTSHAQYDCTLRPWYISSKASSDVTSTGATGALWSDPYLFTTGVVGITASRQAITSSGTFLGVIGADFELGSIENKLSESTANSKNTLTVFVVNNNGMMMASSVQDSVVTDQGTEIAAVNSSDITTASVAQEIMRQGRWSKANGTVALVTVPEKGLHWYQSRELRDDYGMHWHVIVAETVTCAKGYYVTTSYKNAYCLACPEGAKCTGGTSMPYPDKGYWIDRSSYKKAGDVYLCARDTCPGFEEIADEYKDGSDLHSIYQCWTYAAFYNASSNWLASQCSDSSDLQCSPGSQGPMCGSCKDGFIYSSYTHTCVRCGNVEESVPTLVITFAIICLVVLRAMFLKQRLLSERKENTETEGDEMVEEASVISIIGSWLFYPFSLVDRGMLKVGWSTIQILSTIPWNLSINFPSPFSNFLALATITQLDFSSAGCIMFDVSFFSRVYVACLTPIGFVCMDFVVYLMRLFLLKTSIKESRSHFFKSSTSYKGRSPSEDTSSLTYLPFQSFKHLHQATRTNLEYLAWDNFDLVAIQIRKLESKLANQHIYFALLLSYLVLPSVSMIQFNALDCLKVAGRVVLTADTSIDCNSSGYRQFLVFNILLIFIYQSVPLLWFVLLWRIRDKLNPVSVAAVKAIGRHAHQMTAHETATEAAGLAAASASAFITAVEVRDRDPSLKHLAFLWQDYKPSSWYYEVVEIYRRVVFTAVLPCLAGPGVLRVTLGCLMSIVAIAVVREATPFIREGTNLLLTISAYQILITFLASVILVTGSLDSLELSSFLIGTLLICVNVFIVGVAASSLLLRFRMEENVRKWKKQFNDSELEIILRVMGNDSEVDMAGAGAFTTQNSMRHKLGSLLNIELTNIKNENTNRETVSERELKRHLLKPKNITLDMKIGAGAFGEVFKGRCLGETVAIKTMLDVTETNVRAFKAEILINSNLRHPNVVHFIGACWEREMTCLVMEWVSRGSLSNILQDISLTLKWDEPLLRLATDVARGLEYLHSCRYYDETYGDFRECILHRDLKPDNVLITDFLRGKLTDFGTSRAKAEEDNATMSAVGTPLYCAPEVTKGENYDESIDVYSFGFLLMEMAIEGNILTFIGERYRAHFDKKKIPKVMRLIRAMNEEGWRPMDNDVMKIPGCPPLINKMIDACLSHDSKARPCISQIVHDLQEACADEVFLGSFGRWKFGSEDYALSVESSGPLVEQMARNSLNEGISRLSVSSRLSHSAMLHSVDGLGSLRSSSANQLYINKSSAPNGINSKNSNPIRDSVNLSTSSDGSSVLPQEIDDGLQIEIQNGTEV